MSDVTSEVVLHTTEAGVAHVRLNRPDKRNAVDDAVFERFGEIAEAVRDDESVAAIVLSGEGRSFCAGLDFSVHAGFSDEAESGQRPYADPDDPTSGRRVPGRGQRIVKALRAAPAPVIAAVHGHAIGAGFQLMLGADIRIVTPGVLLGLKEIDYGMTVDMGATQLLPRLIGTDKALELMLSGRLVTGEEAWAMGLATRLADDPLAEAMELARVIAGRSRTAVRESKRLVRLSETGSVADGLQEELRVMAGNIGSPEQVAASRTHLQARAAR